MLSYRGVGPGGEQAPSLLCCGAVHQRLVHDKVRVQVTHVIDSGERHEVAHHALLLTTEAGAVCPLLGL